MYVVKIGKCRVFYLKRVENTVQFCLFQLFIGLYQHITSKICR